MEQAHGPQNREYSVQNRSMDMIFAIPLTRLSFTLKMTDTCHSPFGALHSTQPQTQ